MTSLQLTLYLSTQNKNPTKVMRHRDGNKDAPRYSGINKKHFSCSSAQASISEVTGGVNLYISFIPSRRPALKLHCSVQVSGGQERGWHRGREADRAGSFSDFPVLSLACQGKRAAPGCCLLEQELSTSPSSCKNLNLQTDFPPSALPGLAASRPCTLTNSTGRQAGQLLGHS